MIAFELIAGHSALDLVNTLDWRFRKNGPEELLKSYGDLLRFSEQSKILTAEQARQLRGLSGRSAGAGVLKRCRELREAISEILYSRFDGRSPSAASLKLLERSIQAAQLQQRLRWKKERLEWDWKESHAE